MRVVNERIAETPWLKPGDVAEFICECSAPKCTETVPLTLAEYRELKERGPILKPGHSLRKVPSGSPRM